MKKNLQWAFSLSAIVLAFALSSCTATPPEEPKPSEPETTTTPSSPSSESSKQPSDGPLVHFTPKGEKEIGAVDNQSDQAVVADFRITEEIATVYLRCAGTGMLTIQVQGHGDFPLDCASAGEIVSQNEFSVGDLERTQISVRPDGELKWAASVTAMSKAEASAKNFPDQEYQDFLQQETG